MQDSQPPTEDKQVRRPEKKEIAEEKKHFIHYASTSFLWLVLLGLLSFLCYYEAGDFMKSNAYFVLLKPNALTSDARLLFSLGSVALFWVLLLFFFTLFRAYVGHSISLQTSLFSSELFVICPWLLFAWVGFGLPIADTVNAIYTGILLLLLLCVGILNPYWFTGASASHSTQGQLKKFGPFLFTIGLCTPLWMRFGTELHVATPYACVLLGIAWVFTNKNKLLRSSPLVWAGWLLMTTGPFFLAPYNTVNAARLIKQGSPLLVSTILSDPRLNYKRRRYMASPYAYDPPLRTKVYSIALTLWAEQPKRRTIRASLLSGMSKNANSSALRDFLQKHPALHTTYTKMIIKSVHKNRSQYIWTEEVLCPAYRLMPKQRPTIEKVLMRSSLLSRIPTKRWKYSFLYASGKELEQLHLQSLRDFLTEASNGQDGEYYRLQATVKKCFGQSELARFGKHYLTKPRESNEEKHFEWLFWWGLAHDASSGFYSRYEVSTKFFKQHAKAIATHFQARLQDKNPRIRASFAAVALKLCLSDHEPQRAFCAKWLTNVKHLKPKEAPRYMAEEVHYLLKMFTYLQISSIKQKRAIQSQLKEMTPKKWEDFFKTFTKRYPAPPATKAPSPTTQPK